MSRPVSRSAFILAIVVLLVLIGASAIFGMASPGAQICNANLCQSGTSTSTFLQGGDISNTVNINFATAYTSVPTLVCCAFTSSFAGLQPNALSWSTVFVPQQIRNATNPSFDLSARHDQNNSTCSPCTNKITITPSGLDEVLLVHIFYISDVAITVSSVTASGLSFTPIQPFGVGIGDEIWSATTFTTGSITVTVSFNAPGSTIVTTSVVGTLFANSVVLQPGSNSASSTTSPITVANQLSQQFSMVVGNSWLSNAGVACSDPTPGSGQTQILNANVFCNTNVNGGTGFLYNYDVEYFNTNTQASYNYLTNFNGTTGTGLSVNVVLFGGGHHDRLWSITGTTNSTLYNSDQYDTALNPPFQSQAGVANQAGHFYFSCNYANENVSLTMTIQFGSTVSPFTPFTDSVNFNVGFSGTVCDGNIHTFTIQNSYALADNSVGRVIAFCKSCPSALMVSISSMFIGWRMIGQVQIRESISSLTVTGFSIKWLASFPAPSAFSVTWTWNAIGN